METQQTHKVAATSFHNVAAMLTQHSVIGAGVYYFYKFVYSPLN